MRIITAHRTRVLEFSLQERAALEKAADIARRARELMREELGVEDTEGHEADPLLAALEHNHKKFEGGYIVLK